MNWIIFAFITYFVLGFDLGLRELFTVQISNSEITPSFMLIFMVLICSMAPTMPALWSAMILGLLVDLTCSYSSGDAGLVVLIGPYALGYMLGALLILQVRTIIYRRHPFTMALLTFAAGIVVNLLAVFMISVRYLLGNWMQMYDTFAWSTTDRLFECFFILVYSALMAIPLGYIFMRISPIFNFQYHPRLGMVR